MLGRLVAILVGVDYNIDKDHAKRRQNIVLEMKQRQECVRLLLAKVTI